MNAGEIYYVRIDYQTTKGKADDDTRRRHIEYVKEIAAETPLVAGSFGDNPAGMILFKADSYDAADRMCRNDPIILNGFYTFKLYQWNVLISSYILESQV